MEHGAGLTPDGRTGEPHWLWLASHAPFHGRIIPGGGAGVRRLQLARARRAVEQCVAADERRAFSVGCARFARAS